MTYTITSTETYVALDTPSNISHGLNKKVNTIIWGDGTDVQDDYGKSGDILKLTGKIITNAYNSVASINTIMDNQEIVTITGLPDSNHDTDYYIKNFSFKQNSGMIARYDYSLSLERIRDRL